MAAEYVESIFRKAMGRLGERRSRSAEPTAQPGQEMCMSAGSKSHKAQEHGLTIPMWMEAPAPPQAHKAAAIIILTTLTCSAARLRPSILITVLIAIFMGWRPHPPAVTVM